MSNTMRPRPKGQRETGGRAEGIDDASGRATDAEPEAVTELSESDVFDILRNSRRRAVIAHLRQHDGQASLEDVTEHVAATEYDVDAEEVSSAQYKCVYTGLYQCHLPRLEKFDVVDFDKEDKSVRLAENASRVESYLYRGDTPDAVRFELAGATVVSGLTVLGATGIGPFGLVPVAGWAVLIAVALFGFALFHLYR